MSERTQKTGESLQRYDSTHTHTLTLVEEVDGLHAGVLLVADLQLVELAEQVDQPLHHLHPVLAEAEGSETQPSVTDCRCCHGGSLWTGSFWAEAAPLRATEVWLLAELWVGEMKPTPRQLSHTPQLLHPFGSSNRCFSAQGWRGGERGGAAGLDGSSRSGNTTLELLHQHSR